MSHYLLSFVIGSIVLQSIALFFIGKKINRASVIICIAVTFLLMLPIEIWATNRGIWSWGDHITYFKLGNIPFEEILLYITSAVTTVVIFECIYTLAARKTK